MKRIVLSATLVATALAATVADTRVTRAALQPMEKSFNKRIQTLDAKAPYDLLGVTRGVYLQGFGVVFTTEVNLLITTNTSPFQQTIPKAYAVQVHTTKLERLPILKKNMREMLLASAGSLDTVPGNEPIALGVTLFYYGWEDTTGLPAQIVMQAPRQKLLDAQHGGNKAELESIVQVQEF